MMMVKKMGSKRWQKQQRKKARRRAAQEEQQRLIASGQFRPPPPPKSPQEWREDYTNYINSDAWKVDFRNRYLASKLPKRCAICDRPWDAAFHLHHRSYKRLGREWLRDVKPVCQPCHEVIHRLHRTEGFTLRAASKRKHVLKFLEQERKAKLAKQPIWMQQAPRRTDKGEP
jgi:hypothetical protein